MSEKFLFLVAADLFEHFTIPTQQDAVAAKATAEAIADIAKPEAILVADAPFAKSIAQVFCAAIRCASKVLERASFGRHGAEQIRTHIATLGDTTRNVLVIVPCPTASFLIEGTGQSGHCFCARTRQSWNALASALDAYREVPSVSVSRVYPPEDCIRPRGHYSAFEAAY